MLATPDGELTLMTATSEAMQLVELFELQSQEGPCQDCFRTGQPVVNQDLTSNDRRWPRFAAVAVGAGFFAADAIPMRLRTQVIGAVNLFRSSTGSLSDDDVAAARALADIATIAILQHRATLDTRLVNQQLSEALASRIVIEQAKGMIAERHGRPVDAAFAALRHHARGHNQRLAEVARGVVSGTMDLDVLPPAPP